MQESLGANFWRISFSIFFFILGFNLILPEMNTFISRLGGESNKGLIITLFSISALLSRPISGKLSDLIGRKKVIYFGIFISVLASLFYPLFLSVPLFLALRFFHGLAAGFTPTGATALVTDIIPENKRGHAMGIWGTFISLGIGIGQGLGSFIYQFGGFNFLFFVAALFSSLSLLLTLNIKETLGSPQIFSWNLLKIRRIDLYEKKVTPAAITMVLTAPCSGFLFVLTPDISENLGIEMKGLYLGIYAIPTILIRLFYGRFFENVKREFTMIIACCFLLLSILLLLYTNNISCFISSALIFGIATGISSPTLFAWTADLSPKNRRGVGAGTVFIALELGVMIGSASTLLFYNGSSDSIQNSLFVGITLVISALIYLSYRLKSAN
ncbi:MAG: MFS transporter [Bacteroidetes bacterium]|nr:MFS transporter [Bacteroidota bacterium]